MQQPARIARLHGQFVKIFLLFALRFQLVNTPRLVLKTVQSFAVARGGKIVVSGLMGGNFSLPMVQWIYKRMTIEGFMVGTLAEARELMALARSGKIKPTPMKEEPMGEVQKWIDELRAGKVVGRIVLKN